MNRKNLGRASAVGIVAGVAGLVTYRHLVRNQEEALRWQNKRLPALDVLACPECHGVLSLNSLEDAEGYICPNCQENFPVVGGISHFIHTEALSGMNKRFARMYDRFSWGYRAFSKVALARIGLSEEAARREITDRLEPGGGRVLEVSIGPGVNLPYLVGRTDIGEIFGLDISLGQLKRCREYVAHRDWDIQLQLGNAEQLPYLDNTFEAVFHVGGINFFNDKKKAIEEMIRVAKPGARILICDENEKGAQAYERLLPGFKGMAGKARQAVVAPIDLVPPEMQEVRLFDVWKGWMYCIEFVKA